MPSILLLSIPLLLKLEAALSYKFYKKKANYYCSLILQNFIKQWNLDLVKSQGIGEIGSRVRYIKNLIITNLQKNNLNVHYIKV